MLYEIYHRVNKRDFKKVSEVNANSVSQAFTYSRSFASVGDIICQSNEQAYFLIANRGFKILPGLTSYPNHLLNK